MKKLLPIFLIVMVLTVVMGLYLVSLAMPISPNKVLVDFNVPAGASASQIGSNLYKVGLIKNPTAFKAYIQLSGVSGSIQPGNYKLSASYNLFQIVDTLAGTPTAVKVTIPEGFTNLEIAAKYTKSLGRDKTFTTSFLTTAKGLDGYLFPDTYLVSNNISPEEIVTKMQSEFKAKTINLNPTRDQIILASIIERETKGKEERPVVAGILLNRLNAGMPLQVDIAPVTYQKIGLPPDPIANPGLVSIDAAVNPVKTDYWYYIHDKSGNIHYAKTLAEQDANIRKYLQ